MVHLSFSVEQGIIVCWGEDGEDYILGEFNFSGKMDITIGILTKVEMGTQPRAQPRLKIIKEDTKSAHIDDRKHLIFDIRQLVKLKNYKYNQ